MPNEKSLPMVCVQSLRALHKSNVKDFLSMTPQDDAFIQCTIRPMQRNSHHTCIICGCRRLADRSPCCDQFMIGSPLGHECIVCALLYDSSMKHHRYDVSSLDSRQPVSDDDAGSSFSRLIQSRLDSLQENRALSGTFTHVSR